MLRFEDDVAQKVVEGLSVQLSGAEQESRKLVDEIEGSYSLLLQARRAFNDYFINSRLQSLRSAQQWPQRAIEKDPTFVDAYASLADLSFAGGHEFRGEWARPTSN